MRGFVPARRGPFVSAKGPKTIGARAWPSRCLCHSPSGQGCGTRFAQTVLAAKQLSGLERSHARRRRGKGWVSGLRLSHGPVLQPASTRVLRDDALYFIGTKDRLPFLSRPMTDGKDVNRSLLIRY